MASDDTTLDTFEIDGPLGTKARARGPGAMLALLIVVGFTAMTGLWWVHHQATVEDHAQIKQEANEMIYVLSLSNEERAKLNLSMPESLRKKTRGARGNRDDQ